MLYYHVDGYQEISRVERASMPNSFIASKCFIIKKWSALDSQVQYCTSSCVFNK